jgi:type I restriction enzyme, R subunit
MLKFLSQIFDYGNTEIEKRSIFFRLLHPLLTFGREREGVDLSALELTAYTIKSLGEPQLKLGAGEPVKIDPIDEPGSGEVQDKNKIALAELIEKVNDLFVGDLTPGDKLVYVNDVIKGKLMESEKLAEQALNNTKEQFANSPDLASEIMGAVMDALAAHTAAQAGPGIREVAQRHEGCAAGGRETVGGVAREGGGRGVA